MLPLILNNCNFVKADPALLSFDDARTLFHEFGHALHGLLSQGALSRACPAPMWRAISSNCRRSFSSIGWKSRRCWSASPAITRPASRCPQPLLDKLLAARNFNQGFATVEFLASAIIDMDFHSQALENSDPAALQAATLARIGMPEEIVPRHAAPHFGHVFAGDGYSAGYYSYLWSEVLDADGFGAFRRRTTPSRPQLAKRLYEHIYSSRRHARFRRSLSRLSAAATRRSRPCWKAADWRRN